MTDYVKNELGIEISPNIKLVVSEGNSYRPADTLGGKVSTTGKTSYPTWIEEGYQVAHSVRNLVMLLIDSVDRPEVLEKLTGIYFIKSKDENIFINYDVERLKKSFEEWKTWRLDINRSPAPLVENNEDEMAKTASRDIKGACLTGNEAVEGLPNRFGACGSPTIYIDNEPDQDGDYYWEVIQPGIGRAFCYNDCNKNIPPKWGFEKHGSVYVWERNGYKYRNVFVCNSEQCRWQLSRTKLDNEAVEEYEQEEDSYEFAPTPLPLSL